MRKILVSAIILLGLVAAVLVVGAGRVSLWEPDVVTHEYESYLAAASDRLFAGGWLPKTIPASAKGIVTINNLDRNTSRGEFHYDPAETADFVSRLRTRREARPLPATLEDRAAEIEAAGYRLYVYRQNRAVWIFFVNPREGHVLYGMEAT